MKKTFLITSGCFMLLFLISTHANAQDLNSTSKHEIRAQISDGSPFTIATTFLEAFVIGIKGLGSEYDKKENDITGTPHFGIGYRYHFSERFSAGLDLSYQSVTAKYAYEPKDPNDPIISSKEVTSLFLIMPAAAFKYLNNPNLKLYGNIAAGVAIGSTNETIEGGDREPNKGSAATF